VRVAVLVSGTGTILSAMLEREVPVALVAADRPCPALERAEAAGVPAVLADRRDHGGFGRDFDREGYTEAVTAVLAEHRIDLVAMAGFGTVLTAGIHQRFPGRVLNTHPSLLPAFPGWHAVDDALAAGVTVTGCTVHVATVELDAGPVLAQEEVPVLPDDTAETLHERIKEVERRLYPATVLAMLDQLATSPAGEGVAGEGVAENGVAGAVDRSPVEEVGA
jgi:phosphoribosylglycinamide formyltransferase-1